MHGGRIDGDRLRDAIAARADHQLGRAFDILDEHGEWRPDLALLEVRFTGAAAGLSDDEKRALYARVGEGVARGARGAHVRRGGGSGTKPRSPSPAREAPKPQQTRKISSTSRPISTWIEFERVGDEVFKAAFALAADRWWQQHGVGAFPSTYGMLFRLKGVAPVQLWIVANGAWVARRGLTIPNWSTRDVTQEPQAFEPSTDYLWLEEEPDGLAKWRELARKRASKQRAVAGRKVGKVAAVFDTNAPQAAHSAEVTAAIDAYTRGWETSKRAYYWLKGVGDPSLIPFGEAQNPSLPRQPKIPVVALVDVGEIIEITEENAADGAGSGAPALPTDGGSGGRGADEDGGDDAKGGGRGGRGGSGVTAPQGQDVGEGGKGIVIAPEYKAGGSIFPALPSAPGTKSSALPCEPYDGELPFDQLPTGGAEIRDLITKIAAQLDMAPCPWPAHFCIQASRMIRIRASQIEARFEIDTTGEFSAALSVGVLDEDGGFTFRVLDSVAIQYLQRLAETIPLIRRLMELVRIHSYPVGRYAKHHWFEEVMDEATQACGLIWLGANQIMMQQLLNTSRHAVLQRKGNPDYARMFEVVCKTQLADQLEMIMLRTALERFAAIAGSRRGADAYEHVREHFIIENALAPTRGRLPDVRRIELLVDHGLDTDLVTRLSDETHYVFSRGRSQGVTGVGSIVGARTARG